MALFSAWNMIIPKEKLKKLPIRKPAIACFSVPIVLSPQKAQKSQKSRSHLVIFSVFDLLAPAHYPPCQHIQHSPHRASLSGSAHQWGAHAEAVM